MPVRVFDDSSSAFTYSGSWVRTGTWASADGQRGTISTTNEQGASVSFTFPVPAVAFRFYGLKSSRGSYYGVCVDCDPSNPKYVFVSGYNATDNGTSPPVYFFHQSWPEAGTHSVTIVNQSDRRGIPAGNSVLALDRFELDVPNVIPPVDNPNQSSPSSATPSSAPATSASPDNGAGGAASSNPPLTTQVINQGGTVVTQVVTQSVTASNAGGSSASSARNSQASAGSPTTVPGSQSPNGSSSTSSSAPSDNSLGAVTNNQTGGSSKSTPIGGIVGGVAGGLALIIAVILLFLKLKKRKAKTRPLTDVTPLEAPEMRSAAPESTIGGDAVSYEYPVNEKANLQRLQQLHSAGHGASDTTTNFASSNTALLSNAAITPSAPTLSYASSHSPSSSIANNNPTTSSVNTRLREQDAGPVPRDLQYEGNTATLPPDYGQVFNNRNQLNRPVSHTQAPPAE